MHVRKLYFAVPLIVCLYYYFNLFSIVVTWSFYHPQNLCDPVKLHFVVDWIGIDLRNYLLHCRVHYLTIKRITFQAASSLGQIEEWTEYVIDFFFLNKNQGEHPCLSHSKVVDISRIILRKTFTLKAFIKILSFFQLNLVMMIKFISNHSSTRFCA